MSIDTSLLSLASPSALTLVETVDRLLLLRAELKSLQDEARALEELIKDSGLSRIEGVHGVANVTRSDVTRVDWAAVAKRLEPSRQLITAHTTHTERVQVRLAAHRKQAA